MQTGMTPPGKKARGRKTAEASPGQTAYAVSSICLAQTLSYPPACRRLLSDALASSGISDANQGMAFFGHAVVGLVALDMSLAALRILAVNDQFARRQLEETKWAELDQLWARARVLRNELVYFDERIGAGTAPSLVVDGTGIHAKNGPSVSFEEWRDWINTVEAVGRQVMARRVANRNPPGPPEPARMPTKVSMPAVWPSAPDTTRPRQAEIWFGTSHVEGSHSLVGKATRFPPVDVLFMTAHFAKNSPGPVEVRVLPPAGLARSLHRWTAEQGHQLVTIRINGIAEPGAYDVSIVVGDDPDSVLALGRFWVESIAQRT
jgi:hypothetical protein